MMVIDLNPRPRGAAPPRDATLAIVPFDSARAAWGRLLRGNPPAAHLYHRERWVEVLRRAYRFDFYLALLRSDAEVRAGCLLARSPSHFARRFVALPFSDHCEPLALDGSAASELLGLLSDGLPRVYEIRGVSAPAPWRTVNCFVNWELDTSCGAARLHKSLAANFRRNVLKASRGGVTVTCGRELDHLMRFRALHDESRRRQGLPSQPSRFFRSLWDLYGATGDAEIWLATLSGRDLAAVLVLRDGDCSYYKWSARATGDTIGAGHLLCWSIVEAAAGQARRLDLGRTDDRNQGLNRFKRELGAISTPLPYSFLPRAPQEISSEVLSGFRLFSARIWRRLPPPVCRAIGSRIYRYLS